MSTERDEKTLLQAVALGDRAAFSALYGTHLNEMYRYACLFIKSREEAEEIVQEVFVRLWARRSTLPHLTSFKAYAHQITKNLVVDYWRQQQRRAAHRQHFQPEATVAEQADAALIYQQDYQIAQRAIAQLPPKRKQIFLLSTQQELSLDEIAQLLSISKPVVKKQLYAATAFVKTYLKRHSNWSFGTGCLLSMVLLTGASRGVMTAIQVLLSG